MHVGQQLGAVEGSAASLFLMGDLSLAVEKDGYAGGAVVEDAFQGDSRFSMGEEIIRYNMVMSGTGGGSTGGPGGISNAPSAPAGGGLPGPKDPKSFLECAATPAGEIGLLMDAIERTKEGVQWMEMVRLGMTGDATYTELIDRPLVKALRMMTSDIMIPEVDNFTSEERTPWGGTSIVSNMKQGLGRWKEGLVVGESWEISGHKKFPNKFRFDYAGSDLEIDVRTIQQMFSKNLYGAKATENQPTEMPFLLKLLNSGGWKDDYFPELEGILDGLDEKEGAAGWRKELGIPVSLIGLLKKNYDEIHQGISKLEGIVGDCDETTRLKALHGEMLQRNLSVQVHPGSDYEGLKEGEHSKTESWVIVDAEPGAGIYLGLKEGVTKELFQSTLEEGGDVTKYLNFIPVKAGEAYFIPAGTIHAIGAGVMLVEPQETSETTYRVYDYGRLDDEGNPRELHVKRAMDVIEFDGPRGKAAIEALRRNPVKVPNAALVETLVDEDLFSARRVRILKDEVFEGTTKGVMGYLVLEGSVEVEVEHGHSGPKEILKGQSFIVPDAAKGYAIRSTTPGVESTLIEVSAK